MLCAPQPQCRYVRHFRGRGLCDVVLEELREVALLGELLHDVPRLILQVDAEHGREVDVAGRLGQGQPPRLRLELPSAATGKYFTKLLTRGHGDVDKCLQWGFVLIWTENKNIKSYKVAKNQKIHNVLQMKT